MECLRPDWSELQQMEAFYLFYFKTLSSIQITSIRTNYGCILNNTKQSTKQIIKAKNNGDGTRQAEQVHGMDAYARPTLQVLEFTLPIILKF